MARKAQWVDTLVGALTADGGQTITSLLGGMGTVDSRGLTLARTIVSFSVHGPAAVASDAFQIASLGIGVVSQEGFAANVVPDPNLASDRPPRGWVWRDRLSVPGAASQSSTGVQRVKADVRGMRKVDDGELVLITNNDNLDGVPFSLHIRGIIRCVFLLP